MKDVTKEAVVVAGVLGATVITTAQAIEQAATKVVGVRLLGEDVIGWRLTRDQAQATHG